MGWKEMVPLIGPGLEFLGGEMTRRGMASNAARDRAMQREFAQHGIRWKVADARAAGINPLVALGASTFNPRPVSIGEAGRGVSRLGQAIGRLDFESRHIDNEYKRALTRNIDADTKVKVGVPGQADVNSDGIMKSVGGLLPIEIQRAKVQTQARPGVVAGDPAGYRGYGRPDGSVVTSISEDYSEPSESDLFAKFQNVTFRFVTQAKWNARFNSGDRSIESEIRKWRPTRRPMRGYEWRYHMVDNAWYQQKKRGGPKRILVDSHHNQLLHNSVRRMEKAERKRIRRSGAWRDKRYMPRRRGR